MRGRWLLAAVAGATLGALAFLADDVLEAATRAELVVNRTAADLRWQPITNASIRIAETLGSNVTIALLGWVTVGLLLLFRRFRHLALWIALLLGVSLGASILSSEVARMRPAGVTMLLSWDGYAFPSRPVVGLGLVLSGAAYTLVPAGRLRRDVGAIAFAAVSLLALTRVYLGTDHLSDVLAAAAFGWALPVAIYRLGTPDEAFPLTYTPGSKAHVELTDQRTRAVTRALGQQLGLDVIGIERAGLGGSAGSTPLRMRVRAHDREIEIFAKLYALSHLRSDRWYKVARTMLYGRLEDETPFSTVRRLVEYEDHMLRLLRDAGLQVPHPLGIVEITPEREYLVAMECIEGATELGAAEVDERVIDSGLSVVRRLWDAGVAHRDIKPSNALVRDGAVVLIDVAFATVRPSPWRQAVDLANMMLTLALRSTPERVYDRALRVFAPEDIAEAFAATRGVTIPTQLRSRLRRDGRDLPACFRGLAPPRPPVRVQLWSARRVAVTLGVMIAAVLAVLVIIDSFEVTGLL